MIFIQLDEIAKGHRKGHLFSRGEWIKTQSILESRDNERNTERVQPGIEQFQLRRQPRQLPMLLDAVFCPMPPRRPEIAIAVLDHSGEACT